MKGEQVPNTELYTSYISQSVEWIISGGRPVTSGRENSSSKNATK